ncbi:CIS tube protein [Actinoplanes sp. HUAS TT8]|uniref:CIS tube protein n=1 Tax=Actinoplanes sp. HUAS TT8 TaxID=3447453 RepID=UPI003F524C15
MTAPTGPAVPQGRAHLFRLKKQAGGRAGESGTQQTDGNAIVVPFNPAGLRLQHTGSLDVGGKTAGSENRQHTGVGKATLSFDLEFDTTELGDPGNPVDVRAVTAPIRQFVEAPADNSRPAPPALLFVFGTLRFSGVVTQLSEELTYFLPPDSTPARAILSITLQGVDQRLEQARKGPALIDAADGTDPAQAAGTPAGPGTAGTTAVRKVEVARNGESAAQLAARVGGNPAAWRSLMNGLDDPLALPEGAPVTVGPELAAATVAVGHASGFAATGATGDPGRLAAALGITGGGGPALTDATGAVRAAASDVAAAGRDARRAAGFALAAAGGTAAAAARVATEQAVARTAAARAAFAVPGAAPTVPDPRSLTYGQNIPLRTFVAAALPPGAIRSAPITGPSWRPTP